MSKFSPKDRKVVHLRISPKTNQKLESMAKQKKTSKSQLMRDAFKDVLEGGKII